MTDRNQDHQHQHQQKPALASSKAGDKGDNGAEAVELLESTTTGLFWRVQVAKDSAGRMRVTAVEGELREFPPVFVSTFNGGERRHEDEAGTANPHAVIASMVAFLRSTNLAK